MPITDFHPPILTWFLFERDKPSNILYFQFNPSEMNVDYVSDWEEVDVANVAVQTTQFKQRKPKVFTFDLFLNEWGQHKSPNNDKPFLLSVEEQINWLDIRMYPRQTRLEDKYSPPVLIFKWREYEPVILAKMNVKRTHFRPGRASPTSNQSVNPVFDLNQRSSAFNFPFNLLPQSPNDIPDSLVTNRSPEKSFTAFQPGDAIRATVSITLIEYRKSTASTEKSYWQQFKDFLSNAGGFN